MTEKLKVAVLYGGKSGEHEISLRSAASVIRNLDTSRFEIVPIGIDKQGKWLLNDVKNVLSDDQQTAQIVTSSAQAIAVPQPIRMHDFHAKDLFDVVFPVLHGPLYEDGCLQGLLRLAEVPFVGAGVLSSAISMDKVIAKRLVETSGIKTAPYFMVRKPQWEAQRQAIIEAIFKSLGQTLFVKPVSLGSSVATHKVTDANGLAEAIDDAVQYDHKVLIEKAINAREIECAVLENIDDGQTPIVSIPGEIIVGGGYGFYSYDAKYQDPNAAELIIPAPLNNDRIQEAQAIARRVFIECDCEGMARVDLFLDKDSDEFYFNELNTLPGFTTISMYPKLFAASGISYADLLSRLIDLALTAHVKQSAIKRDWLCK